MLAVISTVAGYYWKSDRWSNIYKCLLLLNLTLKCVICTMGACKEPESESYISLQIANNM